MSRIRTMLVFGTRPEAVKMAPVVWECLGRSAEIEPLVCLTGQHREMLEQVTDYFGIRADERLHLMTPNQTLAGLTARCVEGIDEVASRRQPDCIVAQGDTTTVMATALVAFYRRIPFVHVEAGLRTGNLNAPWPEELNRRIADLVSCLMCAPTEGARAALLSEGVPSRCVRVTGNTVIDALLATTRRQQAEFEPWSDKHAVLANRPMVLITAHRRESFGRGFDNICRAIVRLAARFSDHAFVYPVHLNPNVKNVVEEAMGDCKNIHLIPPATYPEFVWLMNRSKVILTDSGGVQEEAPSLQKPVLVLRDTTERPEAVEAGAAQLVGTCEERIVEAATRLLTDEGAYQAAQFVRNPYGDGRAAERIVDWIVERPWDRRAGENGE